MVGIAAIALVMFALGIHLHLKLRGKGFQSVRETTWRRWLEHPSERKGPIGDLLDLATRCTSIDESTVFFETLRATEIALGARSARDENLCECGSPARAARYGNWNARHVQRALLRIGR